MPRCARLKSETGIYHIMVRGIDKRDLFLERDDYNRFLHYIKKVKGKSKISVLAYCLMTNHAHLLIQEGQEDIGNSIKRITVGYVQYHNNKYARTGHLFQNRYKSEPVQDDKYLLTVIRYIHQNPVKAGIVKSITDYKWSSINEYNTEKKGIVDTDIPIGYFKDVKGFMEFNNQTVNDQCMDYNPRIKYTDDQLKKIIEETVKICTLKDLDVQLRNENIKRIKKNTGASIRQLERVLGVGRNTIQKV